MIELDSQIGLFDQPLYNGDPANGTIPAGAVVQLRAPGVITLARREWFVVGRYNGQGNRFFINGHMAIPYQKTGMGAVLERSPGVHVLFDPEDEPQTNAEWGPIKDQWWIGKAGAGMEIVGDPIGDNPDDPGSGVLPGTRRVKVAALPGSAAPDNIIFGQVQYDVNAGNLTFWLVNIQVVDGVDPRQNPDNPLEPVLIQNVPAQDRKGGADNPDKLKAKQSAVSGLWFPESVASATSSVYEAKLKTDLTVEMETVAVILTRVPDGSPLTIGAELTAVNPTDLLRSTPEKTVYEHVGNADGNCQIVEFPLIDSLPGFRLQTVQPPLYRPVRPTT